MARDLLGRSLRTLRVSVTDRCNLRCAYCMPEPDYTWLQRHDLLSFEEIDRAVQAFVRAGIGKVRLTGGEPLLRRDLPVLVRQLAARPAHPELALTTNGVFLDEQAAPLRAAGLERITVSLDTLRADRFRALTRRDELGRVHAGLDAARAAGFPEIKIDSVVVRGTNDDELADLVDYGRCIGAEVRFIEYMDVGGATQWSMAQVVSRHEILAALAARFGPVVPVPGRGSAPAERFALPDGTIFGIIASVTTPFCAACDRARLTADGQWFTCLYATTGVDLRAPLRAGASDEELLRLVESTWEGRADRAAEERHASRERTALPRADLRRDPHLEMHTRGG